MGSKYLLSLALVVVLLHFSLAYVPEDPRPYGTKTRYDWSFKPEELASRNLGSLPAPSSCSPVYVGGLFKHGMKYPSSGTVKWTQRLLDRLANTIQNPNLQGLNSRNMQFSNLTSAQLSPKGAEEIAKIAQGFGNRFRSLLDGATEEEVAFYSTSAQRAVKSAEAFRNKISEIVMKFSGNNIETSDVASFEENCKKFIDTVRENDATYAQQEAFNIGSEMTSLAGNVTARLDLNGTTLSASDLLSLYQLAAYEEGILGDSPWSDVWESRDEYEILEYQDDVELYYAEAYGEKITREMSCVVMEKFFKDMDAVKTAMDGNSNSSYQKAAFVFGDVKVVLSPASLMGLFKQDVEPTAHNYQQVRDRTFKSSIVAPQGANMAFALYKCTEGEHGEQAPAGVTWPQTLNKYMIQLFYKEISMQIPGACGSHLCPFDDVRAQFSQYIDQCDFSERCNEISMATVAKASMWLLGSAAVFLLFF